MTVDDEVSTKILNSLHRRIIANYAHKGSLILFMADVSPGAIGVSVFTNHAAHIRYHTPNISWYARFLTRLRQRLPLSRKWDEIYVLVGRTRFEVAYAYPEDIDPDEDPVDRRSRIVAEYFGAKPVLYPGFPESSVHWHIRS